MGDLLCDGDFSQSNGVSNNGTIHFHNNHLSYTGQDCQRIPEALGRLYGPQVQIFDLSYNALQSLRGLDGFIKLTELILDNNEITDSVCVPYLPHLHTLSLNKNNISNLEDLIDQVHNKLPVLTYLSLLGNKACPDQLTDSEKDENDYQRYRYYVLYRLPKLKFLDSRPVSVAEKAEALRRGKFMKVVRPVSTSVADSGESTSSSLHYTPLPVNGREADDHKGAYGKCRYRYSAMICPFLIVLDYVTSMKGSGQTYSTLANDTPWPFWST